MANDLSFKIKLETAEGADAVKQLIEEIKKIGRAAEGGA